MFTFRDRLSRQRGRRVRRVHLQLLACGLEERLLMTGGLPPDPFTPVAINAPQVPPKSDVFRDTTTTVTFRADYDADGKTDAISVDEYTYDVTGQVIEHTAKTDSDADGDADSLYQESYSYDSKGHLIASTQIADYNADGNPESVETYKATYKGSIKVAESTTTAQDYDSDGKVKYFVSDSTTLNAQGNITGEIVKYDTNGDGKFDFVAKFSSV